MKAIIVFLLIFSVIVIFHECGHFFMAKRAGIFVREFAIGMGPKIFQFKGKETVYTLRLLPVGGYVRMAGRDEFEDLIEKGMMVLVQLDEEDKVKAITLGEGESDFKGLPLEVMDFDLNKDLFLEGIPTGQTDPERYEVLPDALIEEVNGHSFHLAPQERQFQSASLFNRWITNIMGPINNFILGILVFILLAFLNGGVYSNEARLGEALEDSPAASQGLKKGDKILAVNGQSVESFMEMQAIIAKHPEESLDFKVEREGQVAHYPVTTGTTETKDGQKVGKIGFMRYKEGGFFKKIAYGFTATGALIAGMLGAIWKMITQGFNLNNLGGPVYMYQATKTTVDVGFSAIITLLAYLTVNLGIVNLLPLPALDGGKAFLNILEALRGKPLSAKTEGMINLIGALFLMVLMLAVTWNDILRLF